MYHETNRAPGVPALVAKEESARNYIPEIEAGAPYTSLWDNSELNSLQLLMSTAPPRRRTAEGHFCYHQSYFPLTLALALFHPGVESPCKDDKASRDPLPVV